MEIMVSWFWLAKLGFTLLSAFVIYIAYKKKWKNLFLNISAVTIALIWLIAPFKLNVNTEKTVQTTNIAIEDSKILPPKIEDNEFKERVTSDFGLKEEDLP